MVDKFIHIKFIRVDFQMIEEKVKESYGQLIMLMRDCLISFLLGAKELGAMVINITARWMPIRCTLNNIIKEVILWEVILIGLINNIITCNATLSIFKINFTIKMLFSNMAN